MRSAIRLGSICAWMLAGCTAEKPTWNSWEAPPQIIKISPPESQESSKVAPAHVPYSFQLENWLNVKPQEVFGIIPAAYPRTAVPTVLGVVYSAASATVLVPRVGPAKLLSGQAWKLLGKLPNETVLMEESDQIWALSPSNGQATLFLDLQAKMPGASVASKTLMDSKGALMVIESLSGDSGLYRLSNTGSFEPIWVEEENSWPNISISKVIGSDKFGMAQKVTLDATTVRILNLNTGEVLDPNWTGDSIRLACASGDDGLLVFDAKRQITRILENGATSKYIAASKSDKSNINDADLMIELAGKIFFISNNKIFEALFLDGKYKTNLVYELASNQAFWLVNSLSAGAEYDPFWLKDDSSLTFAVKTTEPGSGNTSGAFLELSATGSVQTFPSSFDLSAMGSFIRLSPSEVLGILSRSDDSLNSLIRIKPGEAREVFKPDLLIHDLINFGVQLASPLKDSSKWLFASRSSLMTFDSNAKSLRAVPIEESGEVWRRDWVVQNDEFLLSIEKETETSEKTDLVSWQMKNGIAKQVAKDSFEFPYQYELVHSKLESFSVHDGKAKVHLWMKFQDPLSGQELVKDISVVINDKTQEMVVTNMPSPDFQITTHGSPFAETSSGQSWELTDDGILLETQPASFEKFVIDGLPSDAMVIDVATRGEMIVFVVLDTKSQLYSLVSRSEGTWHQLEPVGWVHSDIWISETGEIHWKVLDPSDFDSVKLLTFPKALGPAIEHFWKKGCSAENYQIPGIGRIGKQDPNEDAGSGCFFQ